MKLNSGEFETQVENGLFHIAIDQESNYSDDGGYNFVDVTNVFELSKEEAKYLIDELNEFISS